MRVSHCHLMLSLGTGDFWQISVLVLWGHGTHLENPKSLTFYYASATQTTPRVPDGTGIHHISPDTGTEKINRSLLLDHSSPPPLAQSPLIKRRGLNPNYLRQHLHNLFPPSAALTQKKGPGAIRDPAGSHITRLCTAVYHHTTTTTLPDPLSSPSGIPFYSADERDCLDQPTTLSTDTT
ncbi:unnamed protein product [Pleuronectes platessa]|uniref:Uncharacterized protein n=1 Tax=Pleuronectes platessa TaxID=8262 RepID=A0A9N7TNK1_PLEPL|nr:unnamed protein product [Pleuronectes platessa]